MTPPRPDPRWESFASVGDFADLQDIALEWVEYLPDDLSPRGPAALLRTARSLFVHSWFDYEFMVVACLLGFQALEAAFHELYPESKATTPFLVLARRAKREGVLPAIIADLAGTAIELRNWLSHPATAIALTPGMAAPVLENTHRLVGLVLTAATARRTAST